jgi:hypothetical protein
MTVQPSKPARGDSDALSENVIKLDAALQALRGPDNANRKPHIVFRSISYKRGTDIPYGQRVEGKQVDIGDYVSDTGFVSTSEHRQFVLGKEQKEQVNGLLKLAIYGQSGIPIALHKPERSYTNPNLTALYDLEEGKKGWLTRAWNTVFGPGPRAGQAEVLFPRNSVFKVKKIVRTGNEVSVVLVEFDGPRPDMVKDMKSGLVLSVGNGIVIPVDRSSLWRGVSQTPVIHGVLSALPRKSLDLPQATFAAIRHSSNQATDRIVGHLRQALSNGNHDELKDTAEWLVRWLSKEQSALLSLAPVPSRLTIRFP